VTEKSFTGFFIMEVETISFAVFEVLTIGTNTFFCPAPVTKYLVLVLPNICKGILIDVALDEI